MSANQKPTGPQTQRYSNTTYNPIPPQQQRNDGFQINAPAGTYVPQQPNQPGNQGPALRGIAPSGPPNQASTPPTDLKVQSVPQQQMNHMVFQQQQQQQQQQSVQRNQGHYFNRNSTGPPSQATRMPNHQQRNQPLYQTQPQFTMPYTQVFTLPQYYNPAAAAAAGQRPQGSLVPAQIFLGQTIPATQYYPNQAATQLSFPYYTAPMNLQRAGHPQQTVATPPSTTQQLPPNMPSMNQTVPQQQPQQPQQQQQTMQPRQIRLRPNAIPIIDPNTGQDRLKEMYEQDNNNSHPPSGESSARQTPQPNTVEVQATFAKQVAQAINSDVVANNNITNNNLIMEQQPTHELPPPPQPITEHHLIDANIYHPHHQQQSTVLPSQQLPPPQLNRLDIAQSSNLKAQAKEFILGSNTMSSLPSAPSSSISTAANIGSAKEITPVVSANIDAVEITIPKKERESPIKSRKQQHRDREHQQQQQQHSKEQSIDSSSGSVSKKDDKNCNVVVGTSTIVNSSIINNNNNNNTVIINKDEKKKKDNKYETKIVTNENNECASSIQQVPSVQENVNISKTKQNASQRANKQQDVQKQHHQQSSQVVNQQQQKQTPIPVVPQPQPAKPNNKTNKKSEINQKGANKEGTDMDAFNDNNIKYHTINNNDVINANSTNVKTGNTVNINNNDKKNFNINNSNVTEITNNGNAIPSTITTAETTTALPISTNATIKPETTQAVAAVVAQSGTTTIATATSTKLRIKVDITDIVKEKPKPLPKSFVESQDEIDRAAISNDKLVQVKNEANSKVSGGSGGGETQTVIELNKSDLPYREDQWSPYNQDGKKVYDREFLIALRETANSKKRPEVQIPDVIVADERGRLSDGRYSLGGRNTVFEVPPFPNYSGKSSSQRGLPPKRNSQSGKVSGGKGGKPQMIKLSISVREDVKLNEVENAWRPARLVQSETSCEDDKKTEDLYRKVRGVLNKLTPQKFDTLVKQVKQLVIDSIERLQGVIDLVFEKAIDEPNFSVAYALMCKELAAIQVPAPNSTEEKKEFVNFRKLIITRCQIEFEKQSIDESIRNEKLREIEACEDAEKKKELEFELDEYDRKLRMKSVGNIRFIGELFKQGMLTINIMMRCLENLLTNKDEESLECLCKLLTTIGKELEMKKIDLNTIFFVMKEIVDKKHARVSSRVRFMLQDVIDLRKNKWIPRRQDSNPKTMEQIQKEAENEQLNIQSGLGSMNSSSMKKDDRGSSGGGGGSGSGSGSTSGGQSGSSGGPNSDRKRSRNTTDDGWIVTSRNKTPFTVQSDKLKTKIPDDQLFGSGKMFVNWSKGSGSSMKNDSNMTLTNTANMYAALDGIDSDKRSIVSRPSNSKEPYSSKGTSLERNYNKQSFDGGRNSRSGSQNRSNDSSEASSSRSTPAPAPIPTTPPPASVPTVQKMPETIPVIVAANVSVPHTIVPLTVMKSAVPVSKLAGEALERHVLNNIDEYVNLNCTIDECDQDIQQCVPESYFSRMVADGYMHVLERCTIARTRTGFLFGKLINLGTLPLNDYCTGLEEVLNLIDDLIIDLPKVWEYLGEIIVKVICEEALPLSRLHKCCNLLIFRGYGYQFLTTLFQLVITEKGPNFLQNIWQTSGLTLNDFMSPSQVDLFIKNNNYEFLINSDASAPVGHVQFTYEQIHRKLLEFFRSKSSFDEIVNWITANVGDRVKNNKFIRALATAIFENSIVRNKLIHETLKGHYNLLLKYVDNNSQFELQCLYALQSLINKMEHPKGVLLSICEQLYEDSNFSQESFIAWEESNDPAEKEGKGVALKQLTSFFTQLKENDEEEEEEEYGTSTSEDA